MSPLSRTNLPESKFAVSLDSIGNVFKTSVVTATPATDLSCENDIVWVLAPIFVADAKRTTPD